MTIELFNVDCMDYMRDQPDKAFDLAIVDPPYGGGDIADFTPRAKNSTKNKIHANKDWNNQRPKMEYFEELQRCSKNQIIWGGNYFADLLPASRGWVFWDKIYENTNNFSAGELAYTSFDKILKKFTRSQRWIPGTPLNIHPTQKPIYVYEWLLTNYAKSGQRILDTHLGSGSSAIAAHYFGVDFVGCEIDKDYFQAAKARIDHETRQVAMF